MGIQPLYMIYEKGEGSSEKEGVDLPRRSLDGTKLTDDALRTAFEVRWRAR